MPGKGPRPVFDQYLADNFFRVLFDGCLHPVELRSLPNDGPPIRAWHNWDVAGGWARHYWERGTDTHFGVTPRIYGKGKMQHIPEFQLFYADIDEIKEDTKSKLFNSACPPTMVVKSGRGLHVYWRLAEVQPAEFLPDWLRIQSTLVYRIGADRCGKDPVRLLRVPGSYNFKRNKPVVVASCDISRKYDVEEIKSAFDVSEYAIAKSREAFFTRQTELRERGNIAAPPEPLFTLLKSLKCRWRWKPEGAIAVLKKCPACELDRAVTGGSEDDKAWINTDLVIQCWRDKCQFGATYAPGGRVAEDWYPVVQALGWADGPMPVLSFPAPESDRANALRAQG